MHEVGREKGRGAGGGGIDQLVVGFSKVPREWMERAEDERV